MAGIPQRLDIMSDPSWTRVDLTDSAALSISCTAMQRYTGDFGWETIKRRGRTAGTAHNCHIRRKRLLYTCDEDQTCNRLVIGLHPHGRSVTMGISYIENSTYIWSPSEKQSKQWFSPALWVWKQPSPFIFLERNDADKLNSHHRV